jgi:hypothetical protein
MPRPFGFGVLAAALGLYALIGGGDMITDPSWTEGAPWPFVALRLASVVLAAVSAEALWRVRPWATRAVGALAVACFGTLVVLVGAGTRFYPPAVLWLLAMGGVMGLIVWYVHSRMRARFGPAVSMPPRRGLP